MKKPEKYKKIYYFSSKNGRPKAARIGGQYGRKEKINDKR